ncbi:MAG: transposase [Vampirovibrionales bacterium]
MNGRFVNRPYDTSPTHSFMMKPLPIRKTLRLPHYNYSQAGAYFVTFCTHHRECLLGHITKEGMMALNDAGYIVQATWYDLPNHYPTIALDAFVIMPNHVHCVIWIQNDAISYVGDALVASRHPDISNDSLSGTPQGCPLHRIIGGFKSIVTVEYIKGVKTKQWKPLNGKLWQRDYYDHVIRKEDDLTRIREYIIHNPTQWALDENNPNATPKTGNL